jgi:Domain of unknown function (DUF4349)
MVEPAKRRSVVKRVFLFVGGMLMFTLVFAMACRVAVTQLFRGIETSRATGLSAIGWDARTMWAATGESGQYQAGSGQWISRNGDLRLHTDKFERGRSRVSEIASAHHGFLEHLATDSRTGRGRMLSTTLAVPASEFDTTLGDLKKLGRVEVAAEGGEDSAVKLENASRNVEATKRTLDRLQALQRERKGQLHDALEVEKEIAQTDTRVREAIRQRDNLLFTVAQAHIQLMLLEDFRAPLEARFGGTWLEIRNSVIEGASTTISSIATVVGMAFEYGLPIIFWCLLLFWPGKSAWRHWRARVAV